MYFIVKDTQYAVVKICEKKGGGIKEFFLLNPLEILQRKPSKEDWACIPH